jgi:hypothetical protein
MNATEYYVQAAFDSARFATVFHGEGNNVEAVVCTSGPVDEGLFFCHIPW